MPMHATNNVCVSIVYMHGRTTKLIKEDMRQLHNYTGSNLTHANPFRRHNIIIKCTAYTQEMVRLSSGN